MEVNLRSLQGYKNQSVCDHMDELTCSADTLKCLITSQTWKGLVCYF